MFSLSETDETEIGAIVCECGDNFESIADFQKHFENDHQGDDSVELPQEEEEEDYTAYQCSLCELLFMTKRLCNSHIKKDHSVEPKRIRKKSYPHIICEICGKRYSSNAALRYHRRVHTGEKPYHCTMCPKKFTMPLFLQIHVRTHTGEKPYKCHLCPKAFNNKAALLRHDRVHTGIKPYPCPKCGKTFTQSNSMKLHVNTVHYKMPAPYKSKARKLKDATRAEQHKAVLVKTENSTRRNTRVRAEFINFEKLDDRAKLNLIKINSECDDDLTILKVEDQHTDAAVMNDDVIKLEIVDETVNIINNMKLENVGDETENMMNDIKLEMVHDETENVMNNDDDMEIVVVGDGAEHVGSEEVLSNLEVISEYEDDGNVYEIVEVGNFPEMNEDNFSSDGSEIAIVYSSELGLARDAFISHKGLSEGKMKLKQNPKISQLKKDFAIQS